MPILTHLGAFYRPSCNLYFIFYKWIFIILCYIIFINNLQEVFILKKTFLLLLTLVSLVVLFGCGDGGKKQVVAFEDTPWYLVTESEMENGKLTPYDQTIYRDIDENLDDDDYVEKEKIDQFILCKDGKFYMAMKVHILDKGDIVGKAAKKYEEKYKLKPNTLYRHLDSFDYRIDKNKLQVIYPDDGGDIIEEESTEEEDDYNTYFELQNNTLIITEYEDNTIDTVETFKPADITVSNIINAAKINFLKLD